MRSFGWVEIHAVDHCNNNCRGCHNYSPFCEQTSYEVEQYAPWLDLLIKNRVGFTYISIMGGEPMLHPDIIRFAYDLRTRYEKLLLLTTNGFWLSERDIDYFEPLWKMLNVVKFSVYPNIVKRLGGMDRFRELTELLRKKHPHLVVELPDKFHFNTFHFTSEPTEVTRYCPNSQCTALLTDGRMLRCGPGYHHLAQERVTDEFRHADGMAYDLNQFNYHDFWLWRMRYPLEACSYCSLMLQERTTWKVEPGTGKNRLQYEEDYHLNVVQGLLDRGDLHGAIEKGTETLITLGESARTYAYLAQLYDMANVSAKARQCALRSQALERKETAEPAAVL